MRSGMWAVVVMLLVAGGVHADEILTAPAAQDGPTQASTINPYELLNRRRDQLAQLYPTLPERELDKLVFEIAEINSIRSLQLSP